MPAPILATKLYIPQPRPKVILRSRLIERLNEGLHHKPNLISAPAGFGKTTLVSKWDTSCENKISWVSLDEGDNNPSRLLTYLISSLQMLALRKVEEILANLEQRFSRIPYKLKIIDINYISALQYSSLL